MATPFSDLKRVFFFDREAITGKETSFKTKTERIFFCFYWLFSQDLCSKQVKYPKIKFWYLSYTLSHTSVEGRYGDSLARSTLSCCNASRRIDCTVHSSKLASHFTCTLTTSIGDVIDWHIPTNWTGWYQTVVMMFYWEIRSTWNLDLQFTIWKQTVRVNGAKESIEVSRTSKEGFSLLKWQTWVWKRFVTYWLENIPPVSKCF